MRDYPLAHVVHEATCPDRPPGLFEFKAHNLLGYPNGRPHACFSRATIVLDREVVAEPIDYEPHDYKPSTIRPEDATKPLCTVCRGTHGSVDLRKFLRLLLLKTWR